jgi:hypothetical protein
MAAAGQTTEAALLRLRDRNGSEKK